MLLTSKMKQLVAVILEQDTENVAKELLEQGVMHFIHIKEISAELDAKVGKVNLGVSISKISDLKKRIETFFNTLDQNPHKNEDLNIQNLKEIDLEYNDRYLDDIGIKLSGIREKQRDMQQEIMRLQDLKRQFTLLGDLNDGVSNKSQYSFLNIQTGTIPPMNLKSFKTEINMLPSVILDVEEGEEKIHILITMKRDDKRINKILDKFGWIDVEITSESHGLKDDVLDDINVRLTTLTQKQTETKKDVEELIGTKTNELQTLYDNLCLNELYYQVQSHFRKTSHTKMFTGWVPANKQNILDKSIRKATNNRCYIQWNKAEVKDEVKRKNIPVKLKNPKFLAPFEMLVTNFSTPEYRTVNPTPFVALSYLSMFGLMFGDVGHGFVLLLVGLLGIFSAKRKRKPPSNLLKLISYCGVSAMIFGVLFGSYFGMQWLKPIWFDYHGIITGHGGGGGYVKDIGGILLLTVYYGIAVIGIGLILNWVNMAIKGKWFKLFMDKGGILGGWMYSGGVYTGFYFALHDYKSLPSGNALFFLFGLPALLFFFKAPIEHFMHHKGEKFSIATILDFIMEWVIEMLEVVSGYLANTLSFMRVAGLGIAHVSLLVAFFSIADMAGGGFWSIIILIFGNILVIGLEGLSAGIQSLRLNYYEFFSKYFFGSGKVYSPVSLRKK